MCRGRRARRLRRNVRTETSGETTSLATFQSSASKLGRHFASSRAHQAMPPVGQASNDHHRGQRRAIRQANIFASRAEQRLVCQTSPSLTRIANYRQRWWAHSSSRIGRTPGQTGPSQWRPGRPASPPEPHRAAASVPAAAAERGVPVRAPQGESSPGGVYGTLLSGHDLPSARFPWRVPNAGRVSHACMGLEFSEPHMRVFQRSRSV
jgi:hypothetical protein